MKRRILAAGVLALAAIAGTALSGQSGPRTIAVTAQRFAYTPANIVVKKGETVTLEFTSKDFVHGFSIPDLKIRADLPPDKLTRVSFTAEQVGSFEFLCDNFCGAGHEEMAGHIEVIP